MTRLNRLNSCPGWVDEWKKLGSLNHEDRLSNSSQSIWDLWRMKCHWDISIRELGFYAVNIIPKSFHIFSDYPFSIDFAIGSDIIQHIQGEHKKTP
jgi:hypothetical protein